MSNPIDYKDLVNGDPFGRLIKEGEDLIKVYEKLGETLKNAMVQLKGSTGGSPSNMKEAQDMHNIIDATNKYEQQLNQTKEAKKKLTVETAKLRIAQQQEDKETKELAKDQLGLISVYQKESKTLNDLRKQYKDLVLTQGENAKGAKEMLKSINDLDAKLKKVDATVGQHQRNVGNYTSVLHDTKDQLLELGKAMGLAFGVEKVMEFGKESVHAFLEAEKNATDLKNALGGNSIVAERLIKQSETLQDKSIFSDDSIQMAQKQLAVYGLTADEIEKLTPQIVDLASRTGMDLTQATEASISAINGQTKGLKQAGITFKDTGDKTQNLALLTEKLTKFQGASAESLETTIGKTERLANAWDNVKESIGGYLVNYGTQILDNLDLMSGKASEVTAKIVNAQNDPKVQEAQQRVLEQAKKNEKNRLTAIAFTEKEIIKLAKLGEKEQSETGKRVVLHRLKQEQELLDALQKMNEKRSVEENKTAGAKEQATEDMNKKLRDLQTENIRLSWERRKQEILNTYDDEAEKYKGQTKILEQLAIKRNNALEDLYREQQKEYDKIRNEAQKNELKAMSAEDPQFSPKVKATQDAIIAEEELKKKQYEQDRKDAIDQADALYNIWKEAQDKKSAERLQYIDRELEQNKSAIEIQMELASRGMDNTLAYEMKKQDELEKNRVKELERQKKIAKEQEALELSLAFIKAYEGYISNGTKSGQALLKASGDIFTAKLLSKAISGSAFDGVEDTGNGGGMDDKNGMLWMLHPNERVLSKEQNMKLNGIGNDELVNKVMAFDSIMNPNYNSSLELSDVSKSSQVNNALTSVLVNEIKELKEIIKNKPENSTNIDNLGNVVKRTVENGLVKIVTKKTYLS